MANKQNYVKKMEVKNKQKIDAGVISDRFPTVAGIVIGMTYYHNAENPILMQRTVNFFPESHAFFNLECMIKGCENGGFDLKRIISKQIKDKKKVIKGEMSCKGLIGEISKDHSNIEYEINIDYSKKTKKITADKTKKMTADKTKKMTAEKTRQTTEKKANKITAKKTKKITAKKTKKITAKKTKKITAKKTKKITAKKTKKIAAKKTKKITAKKTRKK